MKSKLKMHINNSVVIKINEIIVNIQETPHISINETKKRLESSKIKHKEFQLMSS